MLKNYTKIEVDESGTKRYYNDEEKYHRLDGPAIEHSDRSKFWLINGSYHRNIGPSDEWSNGGKRWMFKDKRHRIGGSYILYKEYWWYIDGEGYDKQEYFNKVWDI